ncbi:MAG: rod shape-determining protein MreD [Caldilineaceae bacterium]
MSRSQIMYFAMPVIVLFTALLQTTIAGRLIIHGVKPDLVLVVVVIATLIYGGPGGLLWAFLGGIGLDLFSGGPFGASSLALMFAIVVAALGHRVLSRYNILVPLGATSLGTLIYGLVYIALISALRTAGQLPLLAAYEIPQHYVDLWPTLQRIIIPAMIYNTTLVLFLVPLLNRVPEQQGVAL